MDTGQSQENVTFINNSLVPTQHDVDCIVLALIDASAENRYEVVLALRATAANTVNKKMIRAAKGLEHLFQILSNEDEELQTLVAVVETLSMLIADDAANREIFRRLGGVIVLSAHLSSGPESPLTHRVLLALRIMTDQEVDRLELVKSGAVADLVALLQHKADSEVTEYAAAVLGNLAAGSQQVKNALRLSGAISPLVSLLTDHPDEVSAELAAVVLRNMSLQNPANRQVIIDAGGLQPLLRLLSAGQERLHYPLPARATFVEDGGKGQSKLTHFETVCCFSTVHGHVCVAPPPRPTAVCFTPRKPSNPRDKTALRFSLQTRLVITEPAPDVLELNFACRDRPGCLPVRSGDDGDEGRGGGGGKKRGNRRLSKLVISPCDAAELKGGMIRMLTRMHLEREFRRQYQLKCQKQEGEGARGEEEGGLLGGALQASSPTALKKRQQYQLPERYSDPKSEGEGGKVSA